MAKIKLTKNELKNQKERLKRFTRYLPMLQLRKKQLQKEVNKISIDVNNLSDELSSFNQKIFSWVDLFAEEIDLKQWLQVKEIITEPDNIAGVEIPRFKEIIFNENPHDLFRTPLWVDEGLKAVKQVIILKTKLQIKERQLEILKKELRIANQRVNLFEKIMIPKAKENIRIITIYLGDQQTQAVIRGKIAKAKLKK